MTTDTAIQQAAVRAQWDATAAGWHRHVAMIRTWLRVPTHAMLDMAGVAPGQSVLDVAAGTGDQSLDVAARVGPEGHVVATDISAASLSVASRSATAAGYHNISTHVADAAVLGLPEGRFDAAVCRLGLMFLPDPGAGLSKVLGTLKSGARFCSIVFAGPDLNPCLRILMTTALEHAGLPPRDPFQPGGLCSLGRPGHLDALFASAGFSSVATTRMDAPILLPTVADYLDFIRDGAAPILQILAKLDIAQREAAWADIADKLKVFQGKDGWCGPNTLLLTVGQR